MQLPELEEIIRSAIHRYVKEGGAKQEVAEVLAEELSDIEMQIEDEEDMKDDEEEE